MNPLLPWFGVLFDLIRQALASIFRYNSFPTPEDAMWMVQQLVQANPSGMIVTDAQAPDIPIIYVNDAFERTTGYKLHEAIGRNCRFLHGTDRYQPGLDIIREALRKQEACVATIRNYRKDGSMFWNEVRISPIRNAAGDVTHFVGIQNDVTARKDAEEELARSEDRYRQIFEDNRAIKLIIDPDDGRIVEANSAAAAYYGYSHDELQAMTIQQINTLSDEEVYQEMQRARSQDRTYFQFRHRLASGEIRDVDVFSSPVDMPEGRYLYSIIIDAQEKREAELRYRALFEQSNDAVFILDLQGKHLEANRRAAQMLGYTPEEIIGLSYRDIVIPDEHTSSQNVLQRMLAGEKLPPYERIFRRKDGSVIVCEVNVEMVHDAEGHPLHLQSIVRDVSERKEMELALRENERRFRNAIDASLDAFYLMESVYDDAGELVDFRIVEANDRALQQMDMPREKLIGGLICELFPVNRENGFFERYKQVVLTGEPLVEEFHIPDEYQAPGWYYHQVVTVGNGIAITTRDITKRKRMEDAVRESEERFRGFVEHSSDGVVLVDEDGRIVHWNESMARVTDLSAEEAVGQYLWDVQFQLALESLRTEAAYEQLKAIMQEMLRTGEAGWLLKPRESIVVGVKGTRSTVQAVTFPIPTSKGYQAGSILRDVTEQKQMADAVRENERRLRAMIEAIPDTIFRNRVDGTYLDWYTPDRDVLVERPQHFMGAKVRDVLPEPIAKPLMHAIREAVQTGHMVTYEFDVPLGAESRHFEVRVVPAGDDEVVSIARDVTEIRRAQQHEMNLALERERSQLLTTFIQNAAHEFRTPLAHISTSAYLMSRLDDAQKRAEKVERIEKQTQQITHLVDMLTLMVKLERPETLQHDPVNLVAVLQYVCRERTEHHPEHAPLHCAIAETIPDITGDLVHLTMAFTQLLDNAMRYTPIDGDIWVQAAEADGEARIVIRDTGAGIAEEHLTKAFETFWRHDEAHTTPGFGLGLPLAQKIIEGHGGTLHLESRAGQGATVTVTLPLPE